jgi:hypothetical protein
MVLMFLAGVVTGIIVAYGVPYIASKVYKQEWENYKRLDYEREFGKIKRGIKRK